jgi:MAX dimerization protein
MNISTLLMAAEYLERKDRELDHGYASTLPCPVTITRHDRRKSSKLRQIQGCRSSHNELEKNRRAHMKHCLELLKGVVPLVGDLTKHTTLGLLTSATSLVKVLRETERMQKTTKEQLIREQQYMRWHYEQLTSGQYRAPSGQYRVRPSVSESSSTSVESSSSNSSELDDIDVIGSGLSDADDQSSDTSDICGGLASDRLIIDTTL